MPAKSQAQRSFLNARKGHAWVKEHGFDNKGKLPKHTPKHGKEKQKARDAKVAMFVKGRHG